MLLLHNMLTIPQKRWKIMDTARPLLALLLDNHIPGFISGWCFNDFLDNMCSPGWFKLWLGAQTGISNLIDSKVNKGQARS